VLSPITVIDRDADMSRPGRVARWLRGWAAQINLAGRPAMIDDRVIINRGAHPYGRLGLSARSRRDLSAGQGLAV
jgi:hypothetical protein